jgi:hypothetical protein
VKPGHGNDPGLPMYPKIVAQKHGTTYLIAVDKANAIIASLKDGTRFPPMAIAIILTHTAYWEDAKDDPALRARLMALPEEPVHPDHHRLKAPKA